MKILPKLNKIFLILLLSLYFLVQGPYNNALDSYLLHYRNRNNSNAISSSNSENDKNVFKPSVVQAQSNDFNPQFTLSLDANNYPSSAPGNPIIDAHAYEGFARIGEIYGQVVAVGYGSIFKYNQTENNWQKLVDYTQCNRGATGVERNNMAVEIVDNKVIIARVGRTGCSQEFQGANEFFVALEVFTFSSDGNNLTLARRDSKLVWRYPGLGFTIQTAVSNQKVYVLVVKDFDTLLLSYNYSSDPDGINGTIKEGTSVEYICLSAYPDNVSGSPSDGPQSGDLGAFLPTTTPTNPDGSGGLRAVFSKLKQDFRHTNRARGVDCSKLRALIASRNHPFLYAFIAETNFYRFVRIGNTRSEWTSTNGGFRIGGSFSNFFDLQNNSFPMKFGFTILDQHTSSDGKVRFAVGGIVSNDSCRAQDSNNPEIVRMQIAGFRINDNNGSIYDYGVFTVGGADQPTGCPGGDGTLGVRMNGGSFTEIQDGNKLKILFGHTFCRGKVRFGQGVGGYQYRAMLCDPSNVLGFDNRVNRLLQLDLTNNNGTWSVSRNWYNPLTDSNTGVFLQSGIGVDVPVDTIYYSKTIRMLFAANDNTQRIPHMIVPNPVGQRGIWRYIIPQTPNPTPQNTCTNLSMSSTSVSPENPRVSITFSGITSNPGGNAQIDLLHPTNDAVVIASASGQAVTSAINTVNYSYTFTREFDYRTFASSHPDIVQGRINSLRVRVKIPGSSNYANSPCQNNLSLVPYSNPKVVQGSFRVESCTFPAATNAFDLRYKIDVLPSNVPNTSVNKIVLAVFPGGSSHPYTRSDLPFDINGNPSTNLLPRPYILIASDQSFQQSIPGVTVHSVSFVGNRFQSTATLSFSVRLDPGNFNSTTVELLNQFLNKRNFFYVAYVRDSTGRVIDTSAQSNWKGSFSISNASFYDYCVNTGLKVSTTGGDFGAYVSNVPRVSIGTQNYFVNMNINRQPFLSDYVIEGLMNCNNSQSASALNWCYQRSNSSSSINISQFDFLQNIPQNEIKRISVSGTSYTLNLSSIEAQYRVVVLQSASTSQSPINVFVTDNDQNDRSLMVICQTSGNCNLTINSIGNVSNFNQYSLGGGTRISYQFSDTRKLQQRRVYINKNGNITLGDPQDRSGFSLYNGALLASGYIVTPNSYRTNIVRGVVYSRGIIARSVNDPINNSLSNLYFRDFVNPILYVDYDPRYLLWSTDVLGTQPNNLPKTIVGL